MKKISLLAIALCICMNVWGWGRVGHAVIAEMASYHLTPEAKAQVLKYLDGKTMAEVASYPDTYRGTWTVDLGFIPDNPDVPRPKWIKEFDFSSPLNIAPMTHVVTVYKNNKPAKGNRVKNSYIANATHQMLIFAKHLKKAEQMDSTRRFQELCFLIHLVGDIHCPEHISYVPADPTLGFYDVNYKGNSKVKYHSFWDSQLITENSLSNDIQAYARSLDTSSEKEIRAIAKGNLYKWVKDCAEDSWATRKYQKNMTISRESADNELKPLAYSQMRKAAYRLASCLNAIFK